MKKNRWFLRALVLLALTGALSMTVTLAAEPGSSKDPLVTLSYLNETFMDSIMQKVDQKITARNSQIAQQLGGQIGSTSSGTAASFTVVTLSGGQVLTGDIGCGFHEVKRVTVDHDILMMLVLQHEPDRGMG